MHQSFSVASRSASWRSCEFISLFFSISSSVQLDTKSDVQQLRIESSNPFENNAEEKVRKNTQALKKNLTFAQRSAAQGGAPYRETNFAAIVKNTCCCIHWGANSSNPSGILSKSGCSRDEKPTKLLANFIHHPTNFIRCVDTYFHHLNS